MKKKIVKNAITIICVLLVISGLRAALLCVDNPEKRHFGDEYYEILYPTSLSSYITAIKILKTADDALSTITDDETAQKEFGELGDLCITDDEAVGESHRMRLVAAHFWDSKGYVWVRYSSEAYDKDGEISSGSWKILARWELEKQDGQWIVKNVNEAP